MERELLRLWVRKLWKTACRAGIDIGLDQTGRLMRAACIEGATRSKRVKTTRSDPMSARHPDLVKRESPQPPRTGSGSPT